MSDPTGEPGEESRPLEPVRRRSLADEIAESLRSRIFDGTYRPGEKLPPERELARQLSVNRGSLREALKKLQHLGLIAIRQGDGTRVQNFVETANVDLIKYLFQEDPTVDRHRLLADLMEVRTHTCLLIVDLAARRAPRHELEMMREEGRRMRGEIGGMDLARAIVLDLEFWERLSRLGGNLILTLTMNTVRPPVRMLSSTFGRLVPDRGAMLDTHEGILSALIEGKAAEASAIARSYLERGAGLFLESHGGETADPRK